MLKFTIFLLLIAVTEFLSYLAIQESGLNQDKLRQAVKAMNSIEEMLICVLKSQTRWDSLLRSVDNRVDQTLAVLRPKVIADHRALLASLGWPPKLLTTNAESEEISSIPNPLVLMQGDKRKSYSSSFLALCALQHLQKKREQRKQNHTKKETGLWAIDELVSPIAARVEYHFTKWVNEPEFMFALVFKLTRDFIIGVEEVLQPLIDEARLLSFSAREAWVFSMVQILADFLKKKVFPVLAENYNEKPKRREVSSSWLHLIDLIVAFDKRMHSLVKSETCIYMDDQTFQGLGIPILNIFCEMPIWLKIWARIEFKDAWEKFRAEFGDDRGWMLTTKHDTGLNTSEASETYLFATREDYKALPIVDSVLKIAWVMVERGQSIPSIPLRIQFIRSTTVRFIWHFFNLLISHCQIGALHADSNDDDDDDEDTIVRVCLAINSARYLESKLQEWSDDVNFLDMSITESDDTCFFREEIKGLAELETSWLMEIITFILRRFEIQSSDYVRNWDDFELQPDSTSSNFTMSFSLLEALDALRCHLHVIKTTLNSKDFLDLWRSIADGLDHFIFFSIITSAARFSSVGVDRFGTEMAALYLAFQPYCTRPEAFLPCIRDSLKVFNMCEEEAQKLMVALSDIEREESSLHSVGVSQLSSKQVYTILRKRVF